MKVAIIGASSLTGNKLIEILAKHPKADVAFAFSKTYAGQNVSSLYPENESDITYVSFDEDKIAQCDVIFSCLPHGKSMSILPTLTSPEKLIIDLGADFRIPADVFKKWYDEEHKAKKQTPATYGLSEIFAGEIKESKFIANPGCYPTTVLLALAPLLKQNIELKNIGVYSLSGRSGAGRDNAKQYATEGENVFSYKDPYNHQHIGEMEYVGSMIGAGPLKLYYFSPHVVTNIYQGMHTTLTASCELESAQSLLSIYESFYSEQPFVSVKKVSGQKLNLNSVVNKNDCLIGLDYDKVTKRLYIISIIDNLVKGASGQAIQNMNLALGFKQTLGLKED